MGRSGNKIGFKNTSGLKLPDRTSSK